MLKCPGGERDSGFFGLLKVPVIDNFCVKILSVSISSVGTFIGKYSFGGD